MRLLFVLVTSVLASAAQAQHHGQHGAQAEHQKSHRGVAVVKSIDAAKGTVMLAHEPIASLNWPKMTMKFIAKERALLDNLAVGKRVEFEFVQRDRDYILTWLH